jgi:hypothetical protein
MQSQDSIPYLLYQSALVEPDIDQCEVKASTNLWLGYKKPVQVGNKINLHCRQCNIEQVILLFESVHSITNVLRIMGTAIV